MGHVNVIWQGDANSHGAALPRARHDADLADQRHRPETLEVRELAAEFGKLLGKTPMLTGKEAPTGWLNNAAQHGKGVRPAERAAPSR